jgi:3-oxoacid CoA-transferase subunit A
MTYITGDTHREFSRLYNLKEIEDDMLIILGDSGINYFLNEEDVKYKDYLKRFNIKLFCIRGNHEERPEYINTYKEVEMFDGKVFMEEDYPNLIFAKDGEIYNIDGKSVLVIGGAYSVDKDYRILYGYKWFKDEQLSKKEMDNIFEKVKGKHFDIVLTHTCPYKYEPKEVFMQVLDQSKVDKSMEHFLDKIEESIDYDKWYCGHFHTEKQIDKLEFMFGRIKVFNKDEFVPKYNANGYEIIRDYCKQNDVNVDGQIVCPKCHNTNIIIQKGDGFNIIGIDEIAIICNDCKKVYGFSDVEYKSNCPKEL